MVARRGRGAKSQPAAKPKTEEPVAAEGEAEVAEVETAEENNGEAVAEQTEEAAAAEEQTVEGEQTKEEEAKPEEPKEEKVESGKLLVENLPPSCLFDYQDKLKELFSKHGEVTSVKRGPIIVTELTTTPTLSAIVEFKNKDSLEKALAEAGTVLDGCALAVAAESRAETAVLVGVPYEAGTDYVRALFAQCGDIAHIHEFSKTKYKILRVTFREKESVEKALKLDRELRINGFLVTVSKYRDEDEQKAHAANTNKNKRQHAAQNRNNAAPATPSAPPAARPNNFRPRGGGGGGGGFNGRGNYRGGRGRGFGARGGSFPRGGFGPVSSYIPPQQFMGRPGYMNDGQRPNKRLRQM
ncbi:uncharacterized protein LOC112046732 isoform X2 [Bicyclus anynana]|uniref:Uncharacterized protein LOC112046732 isoform X2 n=1 Tax=Bicyclus anynana TaxID=110368 RepID=A0A6J1MXD5_BICAN|nr:uncharacterized protein LOC112046732 isoform X2 [Bicyclus anynana]